jgi:hypothetical protein
VIYFNPKDRTRAMGLNIFDQGDAPDRALLVSYLISIFKALWRDSWGPRMEDILRNSGFALSEQPQPVSLLAVPRRPKNILDPLISKIPRRPYLPSISLSRKPSNAPDRAE